jgi:hypothetical protein
METTVIFGGQNLSHFTHNKLGYDKPIGMIKKFFGQTGLSSTFIVSPLDPI